MGWWGVGIGGLFIALMVLAIDMLLASTKPFMYDDPKDNKR